MWAPAGNGMGDSKVGDGMIPPAGLAGESKFYDHTKNSTLRLWSSIIPPIYTHGPRMTTITRLTSDDQVATLSLEWVLKLCGLTVTDNMVGKVS